jgi:hypothetical protein
VNQEIVPVPKLLGNGQNARINLNNKKVQPQ